MSGDPQLLIVSSGFHAHPFQDPMTGKNYVRARWFDGQNGAWLTPDPSGYIDSSNLYAYAGNDPVNATDPSGKQSLKKILVESGFELIDQGGAWNNVKGYGRIWVYSVVNTVTFGFASRHDDYRDAYDRGEVSGLDYIQQGIGVSAGRSAVIVLVSTATGGFGAGLSQGLALSTPAAFAIAGGSAGVGGVLASDVVDVNLLGERDQYSSPGTYVTAMVVGGVGGYAMGRAANVPNTPQAKGANGEQQAAAHLGLPRNAGRGRESIATGGRTPTGRPARIYPDFRPSQTIPRDAVIIDAKNVGALDITAGNIPALRQASAARGVPLLLVVRQGSAFSPGTVLPPPLRAAMGTGPGQIMIVRVIDPLAGARPPITPAAEQQRQRRR